MNAPRFRIPILGWPTPEAGLDATVPGPSPERFECDITIRKRIDSDNGEDWVGAPMPLGATHYMIESEPDPPAKEPRVLRGLIGLPQTWSTSHGFRKAHGLLQGHGGRWIGLRGDGPEVLRGPV